METVLVANFKSNFTESEAKNWLETFNTINRDLLSNKQIILCPSFTLLNAFKDFIKENNLPVSICAQNVSEFEAGPYTGEENAQQINEFADYVLIGHSERRKNFGETEEILFKKTEIALKYNLIPIFLVQNAKAKIPQGVKIVAYEPVFAIGTGNPDTPENAEKVALEIKSNGQYIVLYGGSVNSANIKEFTLKPNINGALIGGASLEAKEFIEIIKNA